MYFFRDTPELSCVSSCQGLSNFYFNLSNVILTPVGHILTFGAFMHKPMSQLYGLVCLS